MTVKTPEIEGERHRRRHSPYARAGTIALGTIALALMADAAAGSARPSSAAHHAEGRAARSLDGSATARLHLVHAEDAQLDEEGPVTGALPGTMRADLTTGAVFTGSFTIRTHGGSIEGRGRATPHGAGRYQSFRGSLVATGGSGRYSHVHGHAGLYGVFDRRTDAIVVQTTGSLSY